MDLNKEGQILFSAFMKILNIDENTAQKMILASKNANDFIHLEDVLSANGDIRNIKCLVRLVLMNRKHGDLSPLKLEDIEYMHKKYGIKIINKDYKCYKNWSSLELMRLFETLRNIPVKSRNSRILTKVKLNSKNCIYPFSNGEGSELGAVVGGMAVGSPSLITLIGLLKIGFGRIEHMKKKYKNNNKMDAIKFKSYKLLKKISIRKIRKQNNYNI